MPSTSPLMKYILLAYKVHQSSLTTYHFDTQWASSITTATILEDIADFSISSRHLEPTTASGEPKSRLHDNRSSFVASSSFSTPVLDVLMIAAFTPLCLRLTTWSTINDINGEITRAKQGAFVLNLKSNTNGSA